MQPVTFSARPSRKWVAFSILVPMVPISWIVLYIAIQEFSQTGAGSADWSVAIKTAQLILAVAVAILAVVTLCLSPRVAGPAHNYLRLDARGLSYARGGKARFWSWQEVSAFERKDYAQAIPQIRFYIPGQDPKKDANDPWVHEMTADGPMVVIRDFYDHAFDEIASTLNAYRRRARDEGTGGDTAPNDPGHPALPR